MALLDTRRRAARGDDAEATAPLVDEAFMGYPTAEGMIRHWAAVAQNPDVSQASRDIADAVSGTHTIAISRTPERLDGLNAEVLVAPDDASLVTAVNEIKQRPGRDIGLPGGVRTARAFARLGLVDQYVLLVEPVAIGAGQPLFACRTHLTLIDVKVYPCGITRLTYRPAQQLR